MRALLSITSLALVATIGACVFELGDVVVSGATAGGAAAGGAGGTGGGTTSPSHEVVIDITGASVTSSLQDAPVLVALDATRIDYAVMQPQGQDLRFYSADGNTELAHEIERWDPAGTSIVWVRLPLLDANTGGLLMRFGDPNASEGQRATEVWSAYVAVYHMADDLSGGMQIRDSSANAHHGTGANLQAEAGGFVGQAMSFDGSSSSIDVGNTVEFDVAPNGGRTLEVMFRRDTTNIQGMVVMGTRNLCCGGWSLNWLSDEFANIRHDFTTGSCCQGDDATSYVGPLGIPGGGTANTDWKHMVVSMDRAAGSGTIYHQGQSFIAAAMPTSDDGVGGEVRIGVGENGSSHWLGLIDELRVGSRAFGADWVDVQYASLNDTLLSYGPITER
jgi:hypothetical protein